MASTLFSLGYMFNWGWLRVLIEDLPLTQPWQSSKVENMRHPYFLFHVHHLPRPINDQILLNWPPKLYFTPSSCLYLLCKRDSSLLTSPMSVLEGRDSVFLIHLCIPSTFQVLDTYQVFSKYLLKKGQLDWWIDWHREGLSWLLSPPHLQEAQALFPSTMGEPSFSIAVFWWDHCSCDS